MLITHVYMCSASAFALLRIDACAMLTIVSYLKKIQCGSSVLRKKSIIVMTSAKKPEGPLRAEHNKRAVKKPTVKSVSNRAP